MAYLSYVSYAETISDTCGVCAYERMVGKYFNWEVGWRAYVEFLVRRRRHMAREVAERGCRNLTEWGYGWGVRVRMAGEEKDDGEILKSLLKRAVFLPEVARAAWAACEEIGGDVREDVWKWWGLGRADLEEEKWALVAVLGAGVLVGGGCRKEGIEIMEGVVERWGGEARWWIGYARVLERGGGGGIREVFERGVAAVGVGEVAAVRGGWEMWEIGQGGGIGGRLEVVERVVGKREGERGGVWAPKRERAGARGGGKKKRRRGEEEEGKKETGKKEKDVDVREEDDVMDVGAEGEVKEKVENRTVFVSNVAFGATEEDLRAMFEKVGDVTDVRVPRRSDGAVKGIAYVEFGSEKGVVGGLSLHRGALLGRSVSVLRSRAREGGRGEERGRGKRRGKGTRRGRGGGRGGGGGRGRGRGRGRLDIEGGGGSGDVCMTDDAYQGNDHSKMKTQEHFRGLLNL